MMQRPLARRWVAVLVLLCLGCGGMMGLFIPELPIALPRDDIRVFVGLEEAGQTRVAGISESMDHEALCRHFIAQLQAGGWSMQRQQGEAGTELVAERGTERLVIEVTGADPPTHFDIRWTP